MNFDGLSVLLLLTTSGIALLGCVFLTMVWAILFVERSTSQGWRLLPLWTFTGAILMDALAIALIYLQSLNARLDLPVLSLVVCWVLLIGTLFLTRQKEGPGIRTLKIGCVSLLLIGCVSVVALITR
jgi:hypothetical protein